MNYGFNNVTMSHILPKTILIIMKKHQLLQVSIENVQQNIFLDHFSLYFAIALMFFHFRQIFWHYLCILSHGILREPGMFSLKSNAFVHCLVFW